MWRSTKASNGCFYVLHLGVWCWSLDENREQIPFTLKVTKMKAVEKIFKVLIGGQVCTGLPYCVVASAVQLMWLCVFLFLRRRAKKNKNKRKGEREITLGARRGEWVHEKRSRREKLGHWFTLQCIMLTSTCSPHWHLSLFFNLFLFFLEEK